MMSYLKTKVKFQSVLEKHINIPFKHIFGNCESLLF